MPGNADLVDQLGLKIDNFGDVEKQIQEFSINHCELESIVMEQSMDHDLQIDRLVVEDAVRSMGAPVQAALSVHKGRLQEKRTKARNSGEDAAFPSASAYSSKKRAEEPVDSPKPSKVAKRRPSAK